MKGAAWIYMAAMLSIFAIIIVYNIMSPILSQVEVASREQLNQIPDSNISSNANQTIDTITNVWTYWPIFLLFGIMLWAIVAAQRKREPIWRGY